ncbi:HpcH/HpaI aldolase/citrate lyase family protein [Rhodococcus wratislaviensis]|uniref:Putative lyase n=1 Tax=Rhodococcus wratislaviensis NBRC 100605 TaxID=1219028 RepID=X0Q7S9_RHOWR|nr:CoA ester lyase [Rhodococcus wratislaviensis]GAF47472.1 putative lyase [Rhodococcus wratislaviensis NBRC 100605]
MNGEIAGAKQPPPSGPAILFCPADRPDRYAKALARADAVIIDLEDAVSADRKAIARAALRKELPNLPADRIVVRVNALRTTEGQLDLDLIRGSGLHSVMVPKAEDPDEIDSLSKLSVIALCETARGVSAAHEIADVGRCVGLMWGGEDLTADIGGWSSRGGDRRYLPHVDYARSRILIAAAASRIASWDGVFLDIADASGLEAESAEAVSMGFAAKVAIHPSQIPVIRKTYHPSDKQLTWATGLLSAVDDAESGVTTFNGRMVDGPMVAMARAMLAARRSRKERQVSEG